MAANKTQATGSDVETFIEGVADPKRRADARALCALIAGAVGEPPAMWGSAIIGFGHYHYRYESGREGDAPAAAFSPRTKELVLYLSAHSDRTESLLARLGRHKIGKSCVYLRSLADVDEAVLAALVADSYAAVKARYPEG